MLQRLLACSLLCLGLAVDARSEDAAQRRPVDTRSAIPGRDDPREARIDSLVWHLEYVEPIVLATQLLEERLQAFGAEHPLVAASYDRLGTLYHRAGMYARAEQLLRIAVAKRRAARPGDSEAIATTLCHLGVLCKDLSRQHRPEAYELQAEALRILRQDHTGDELVFAPIYTALGHLNRLDHNNTSAESLLVRGLQLRRRHLGERHVEVASSMLWLGWFYLRIDRIEQAKNHLQRAQEIFEELGLDRQARAPESYLVTIAILEHRIDSAEALTREAWHHLRRDHPLAPPGLGLRRFTGSGGSNIASLLLEEGRHEEAWEAIQRTSGWGARLFACLSDCEDEVMDDHLMLLRQRLRRCNRVLQSVQHDRDPTPIPASATEQALLNVLQAEAAWMAAELQAMQHCQDNAEYHEVSQIQMSLEDNEAIVGWVQASWLRRGTRVDDRYWGYVIRSQGPIRWQFLQASTTAEARAAWQQPMQQYEESIRRASIWPARVMADADLADMARRVHATWLQPLESHLTGVDRLIVVRDAGQDMLPLECLQDASGEWLLDRFVISYVPSADLYATLRKRPRTRHDPTDGAALVLGDPLFNLQKPQADVSEWSIQEMTGQISNVALSQSTLRDALSGKPESLSRLPRLSFSHREAQAVATAFHDVTLLSGSMASEAVLDSCIASGSDRHWSVVHLATHTLLDKAAPERSAIALAGCATPTERRPATGMDGLLTAREIYLGWKLHADLVTLSGCQTGSGRTAGNGHVGLAQAFLRAGARSLLVSQWKVDDVATALLMERFYQNLTGTERAGADRQPPMGKAAALTEAKQWLRTLRDDNGNAVFAHPVYWAGFILLGENR